jgi:DNA-binding HxlR family transcriptional regulator
VSNTRSRRLGFTLNEAVTAISKWGKQHVAWKARQRPRHSEPALFL